ncbi:MAG: MerR family transcriptional regulator [Thermoleophilaceae bacterium]|nr:MerR family transcriptional regulator [Thermoleophilaceae bacterium]
MTIGQLAAETGVRAGTLRMWESRHGFPQAERLPSGHRRYPQEEVERVLEVILARESGLSLSAAIERVQGTAEVPETSIYAGLRRRRPDLHPYPIPKRLLVAVSHAIEDECEAAAAPAVLVGSFQKEAFYRDAEPRWREFARTAELAVALADFDQPDARPGRPLEVPVARNHPLANEWAIVCDAPGFSACLAGRERHVAGQRIFEMLWSVEPGVVRDAVLLGLDLAKASLPAVGAMVPERLSEAPRPDPDAVSRATSVTNRMLAYVAAAAT